MYAASRRARKTDDRAAEVQIGSMWTGDCRLALLRAGLVWSVCASMYVPVLLSGLAIKCKMMLERCVILLARRNTWRVKRRRRSSRCGIEQRQSQGYYIRVHYYLTQDFKSPTSRAEGAHQPTARIVPPSISSLVLPAGLSSRLPLARAGAAPEMAGRWTSKEAAQ